MLLVSDSGTWVLWDGGYYYESGYIWATLDTGTVIGIRGGDY